VVRAAFVLIATSFLASNACAQNETEAADEPSSGISMSDLVGELAKPEAAMARQRQTLAPDIACVDIANEAVQGRCWAAFQAYFDYYESGFDHRRRVFAWQHFSSRMIFVVVLVLVLAGLFFAWLQFRRGASKRDGSDPAHEVAIGPSGVKVSSPVLGVVILTLSLAFFYLYLIYVYPIQEIL
jgi:hypothetical protein